MPRDAKVILTEILDAIALARGAARDITFQEFEQDRIRSAATERALEIIPEAVRHLDDHMLAAHPTIHWSDIRAIGNKLRHDYHRVDAKTIWDIVRFDLDALEDVVRIEFER